MIVWVTGGTRGIGKSIAHRYAIEGWTTVLTGRAVSFTCEADKELCGVTKNMKYYQCDVSSYDDVEETANKIISEFGHVDVLVNNAGVTTFKPYTETTVGEIDAIIKTNLLGAMYCSKAVLHSMLERKVGTIVMINSMASKEVFRDSSAYSASKAGLKAFADCLRLEIRQNGIKVISIHPGATNTGIWPETVLKEHFKKMMDPDDIANIVYSISMMPERALVEDIYLQPSIGKL